MARTLVLFILLALAASPAFATEIEPNALVPDAVCAPPFQTAPFLLRVSSASVAAGRTFSLTWCDPSYVRIDDFFNVKRFDVYYSRGSAAFTLLTSTTTVSLTIRTATNDAGVRHRYFIRASGFVTGFMPRPLEVDSNIVEVKVVAIAPPVLGSDKRWVAFGNAYTLSWTPVFDDDIKGTYQVYERRSTVPSWTLIATLPQQTTSLTRTNTVGPSGATLQYYVSAVGKSGSGTYDSNVANVVCSGAPCPTGLICAIKGRFQVRIEARDPRSGHSAEGTPNQLNELFGYFSLPGLTANPDNPEVFVKVLDGGNGHFWVFYGTMTDFALKIAVKDMTTLRTREYTRPGLSLCGAADTNAFYEPVEPVPESEEEGQVSQFALHPAPETVNPVGCESSTSLCLIAGRFEAKLVATDQRTGKSAPGEPVRLNDVFGYFTLLGLTGNPDNPEVFVKVLNAGTAGFWVFYGGMTDLGYSLTVTDLATARVKKYTKAPGGLCGAADIPAF